MPQNATPPPADFPIQSQATAAHVLEAVAKFKVDVLRRLDDLEDTVGELKVMVTESGLNGHTPLLKEFLDQYAADSQASKAWQTVRRDLAHRLRWLAPSKHWLAILFAGMLGAIGWQVVSHLAGVQLPGPF